jgi:[acyl-carrier-protein] S-malonyltransferase
MLALLCGGQGRLSAHMFDLSAAQPEATAIFDKAHALLGSNPRDLVRCGDDDVLLADRTSQLLSVTTVLATHACIADILPEQVAVTGYSVGEMAAWSIAGVWTAETALQLTDSRARAMDAAGGTDGRLGDVRGLARHTLETLAVRHGCAIAITNPGNLFVVGGAEADVAALCRDAMTAGAAHAELLEVKIAAHTARLEKAIAPFREALEALKIAGPAPGRVMLAGGDGGRIFSAADGMARLAAQVATPIDWAATMEALVESGVDRVLDLGPGQALANMVRSAFPTAPSYAVEAFRSLEGVRSWILAKPHWDHKSELENVQCNRRR